MSTKQLSGRKLSTQRYNLSNASLIPTYITSGIRYVFDGLRTAPTSSGWTDYAGYGNLTFSNSPTVTTVATSIGPYTYATFNGTNQYGYGMNMQNLTTFTMTTWFRSSDTTDNGTFYLKPSIWGSNSGGAGSRDFCMTYGGGYAGYWSGIGSGDTSSQPESGTSAANYLAGNGWFDLTITSSYTNGSILYINGVQFGSALTANQATETQNWFMMAQNSSGSPATYCKGDVAVLLAYTRELTAAEVLTNYNSYRRVFGR